MRTKIYPIVLAAIFLGVASCKDNCPDAATVKMLQQQDLEKTQKIKMLESKLKDYKNPENMTLKTQDLINKAQKLLEEASTVNGAVADVEKDNANLIYNLKDQELKDHKTPSKPVVSIKPRNATPN